MAIIPGGQQIRTNSADVDLTNRGNALVKKQNQVYTMNDIIETVSAGGSSPLYKTLVFTISNAGTGNPTVSVHENTLDVSFTSERIAAGGYRLNFSESVPTNIMVSVSPPLLSEDNTDFTTVVYQNSSSDFIIGHYDLNRVLTDNIYRSFEIKFYE